MSTRTWPPSRKRPGRRQHEQRGVAVDDRLGQPDRAEAEHVAHQHHGELHQHHQKAGPGHGAPDRRIEAVDAVGECQRCGCGAGGFRHCYIVAQIRTLEVPMAGHDHDHHARSRPRSWLGALRDAASRARAGNHADREGLYRPGRARRHHRGLRDQDRAAQRRRRRRQGLGRSGVQEGAAGGRHQGGRLARPHEPRRRSSGRGREHAEAPQHDRVHAVLLLPVGGAGPAAGLVQVGALSLARGDGPARRAQRFRRRRCRRTPRSGSGIPPPRRASSCCRCGPPAPKAGARTSSPIWSRATR